MSREPAGEDGQQTMLGEYAGFVTRLIGFVIDLLIVAVVLAIVLIMILGTMAENRWCGPVLCSDQTETY